jgi:hypothetical protein
MIFFCLIFITFIERINVQVARDYTLEKKIPLPGNGGDYLYR